LVTKPDLPNLVSAVGNILCRHFVR